MLYSALYGAVYVALALAAVSAFRGGPAAGALVVSNILSLISGAIGTPFGFDALAILDLWVIACVVIGSLFRGYILRREIAILSLFLVAWRFYWVPTGWEHVQFIVLNCVVILQLMLTLPWRTIFYLIARRLNFATGPAPDRLEAIRA